MAVKNKKTTKSKSSAKTGGGTSSRKKTNSSSGQKQGKASSSAKSQTAAARSKQEEHSRRQIWAVILFVVGLLLFAVVVIKGQNVWMYLHNFLYGVFGMGVFLVPLLLIYIAYRATVDENMGRISFKLGQSFGLMSLVCGGIQTIFLGTYPSGNFFDTLTALYQQGQKLQSGGILSALIGWPLTAACGRLGASIILILFVFAFVLLVTGATLLDAFRLVTQPVKKMEDQYIQIREEKQQEKAQQRFNIDVDLGPDSKEELPQHPVSSPKKPAYVLIPDMEYEYQPQEDQTASSQRPELDFNLDDLPLKEQKEDAHPAEAFLDIVRKSKEKNQPEAEDRQKKQEQLEALVEKAIPRNEPETPFSDVGKAKPEKPAEEPPAKQPETEMQPVLEKQLPIYKYPPVSLLKAPAGRQNSDLSEELKMNAELLVNTLKSFGVQTRVIDISRGPTVTRYELQPSAGVKISKITGLADDIALNLAAAGVRIEAPIPNKAAVGIEVPNKVTETVSIREIIDSTAFKSAKSKLSVALGRDISGKEVVFDVAKMPHMLIAGATGSGKSVCINTLIISLLYKSTPDEVRLLMIDPKVVELGIYNGIPHLLVPVVTDPRKAAGALGWAVTEMLNRYKLFAENQVRDLTGYNELAASSEELNPLPQIVIIIDELADLMMAAPNEVEDAICRLAQMARAAGMHLVIATQRPSVDVITGVIKANIPSRIAFSVSSQVDSRTIIDSGGAEKLLGRGDMLFYPVGMPKPTRLQCCYVSDKEVEAVVDFVKNAGVSDYDDKIIDEIERQAVQEKQGKGKQDDGGGFDDQDQLLPNAIEAVIEAEQASTTYLQRKLKVGYARAARLMDELEAKGIVGPYEGSKPRQVLISRNQWIEMKMNETDRPSDGAEE